MKMKLALKKLVVASAAVMLLLSGCGPKVSVKHVDNTSRPPNTGQLDIYNSPEEVKKPYQTIKIMRVEDDRVEKNQNEGQMKERLAAKAKESGADAIIITKTGVRRFRVSDGMGGSVPYSAKYMEVEAIVYSAK